MTTANPTEVTAREKFPCPACGAQAEWNPAKQKLVCPFCGTESPYQVNPATGAIEEIDLVKTLRDCRTTCAAGTPSGAASGARAAAR